MKALVLTADGVEDSEFLYPYYRLKEEGVTVDVAGPEKGTVTGKHGYTFDVDKTFADLKADDYQILVLSGGKAPETVRLDDNAVAVAKKMAADDRIIAAVCHGAQTLISADLLKGKKATCWWGVRDDLKAAGADYRDEEVVVDGTLITSRCPDDLPAFCRDIFKKINR